MIAVLHLWNFVAAGLWGRFLGGKLRHVVDKQSSGVIAAFFMAGVVSVVVTSILHELYPLPWLVQWIYEADFWYQVLVTGVLEETAKFICFFMIAHYLSTVKEPQDGVLQGAAVGLGFATLENILYITVYPQVFIAIRPLLATGGHMVYGAVWGGLYSAAVWSNAHSDDPGSYRLAVAGVVLMAVFHGLYNSVLVFGLIPGIIVDGIVLTIAVPLFLQLQLRSPYRRYPLEQAKLAIPAIERGLVFNRKSPILNRRLGLYLMRLGDYQRASVHLSRAMPRTHDRLSTRFFAAVCESTFLPHVHAERGLRVAWGRLPDEKRAQLLEHLERLLVDDAELLEAVREYLASAFTRRRGKQGHELAREIKLRKAQNRRGAVSRTVGEHVSRLSREEREALRRKFRGAEE
ncbi:MAG: PrsW family intramembrane metalloprotease [Spirochaetes bacterium]|nr:PrsW family intramembrane metalloprotease [Spirochaetota bacterium]